MPYIWGPEQEKAFSYMKKVLTSSPVLQFPDFTLPFFVQSDASDKGSTIEKEAFALIWSVKYFRHYLYGCSFTIYTDHNLLKWLFTLKSPEGRLTLQTFFSHEFDTAYASPNHSARMFFAFTYPS